MPKTQTNGAPEGKTQPPGPPPLTAGVRRHLGLSLRSLYAGTLAEPVSERMESLLARLGKTG